VVVDRFSVEIFAADGMVYMPMRVNFDPAVDPISVRAAGGAVLVESFTVHSLGSLSS
jgi:sucrose-6-phosphate hydrolase SacC (GH32 family)